MQHHLLSCFHNIILRMESHHIPNLLAQEALVSEIPHNTDLLSQDTQTLPLQDNHSSFPTNNQQKNIFVVNDPEVTRCGYAVESQNVATVKLVAPDKERKYAEEIAIVYKLSADTNNNKEKVRSLICSIMTSQVRKICFDAQESIAYLVKKFDVDHKQAIGSWVILDPKVGGWLLNPEHPPITFKETALLLQAPILQVSCGHQDDQLYCDLEALSHVTRILHARLCHHQLWTIFHLEMRVMPILAVMELRGIRVDRQVLKRTGQMLKLKIQEVEKRCHEVSGSVFNVTSYSQLRTVLFQELKLDVKNGVNVPRTSRGQKSTSEVALGRLLGCHRLPALVLRHRLLSKLKTTYVDGIMACLQGSYIKASWEQTSACTGRIQCCNPNLQSIPKQPVTVMVGDTETVVLAREFFCSRDGYVLVSADFQQMELRVLAHLSQDAMLQAGFKQSKQPIDIFKQLSSLWLEKDVFEVTPSERERTKRVVYAVIYGAGQEKLAEVLQISPPEAMDIITSFIRHFPSIPSYMRSVVDLCRAQGFLTTIFSRRRFFPRITSHDPGVQAHTERQAVNFVIQGSGADISKAAMVQTGAALASHQHIDASLLIHIHDELVWEVRSEHLDEFIDMVRTIMEDTHQICGPSVKFSVPLPVSICTGLNWAHMHPWTHF
ncbi:DNA polymerase nu-like isoform X2 [Panulirus ornatus]|uniref:DNA polymerase nu-like isoform X2 n=1 Tax=Panulirus ornatus TaxID=150431 RepID=UPI003A87632D